MSYAKEDAESTYSKMQVISIMGTLPIRMDIQSSKVVDAIILETLGFD